MGGRQKYGSKNYKKIQKSIWGIKFNQNLNKVLIVEFSKFWNIRRVESESEVCKTSLFYKIKRLNQNLEFSLLSKIEKFNGIVLKER